MVCDVVVVVKVLVLLVLLLMFVMIVFFGLRLNGFVLVFVCVFEVGVEFDVSRLVVV